MAKLQWTFSKKGSVHAQALLMQWEKLKLQLVYGREFHCLGGLKVATLSEKQDGKPTH